MKLCARIASSSALLLVLASTVGCTKLKARDQLVKGVQAFKSGQYERAVDHFQESIKLDPDYATARLDLAAAYAFEVVPNLDTPDNLKLAQKAMDGFNEVLAKDPNDIGALRQIASIHFNIKQLDQAKLDELKVISLDPNDSAAHDMIGSIDFMQANKNEMGIFAAAGITDDGNGTPKKSKDTCEKVAAVNGPIINDGLSQLQQAININHTYEDAMQYMNLMYRRKANIECGNDDARKADIAQADQWVQKAMGARKANEAAKEKKLQGGIDVSK
jgi:tetratricopeptide (TPR) repeat protein